MVAAVKYQRLFDEGKTKLEEPDARWKRFQTRLLLFPKQASDYADLLRQIGEEDNRMLLMVLFFISFNPLHRHLQDNSDTLCFGVRRPEISNAKQA